MKYKSYIVDFKKVTDGAVMSDTPPEDTTKLWCDTSVIPNQLKYYNPESKQWELLNDNTDDIIQTKKEFASEIEQVKNSIALTVKETVSKIGDLSSLVDQLENKMVMTSEFTDFVKKTIQTITDLESGKVDVNEILEWARFDGATLELGASNSNFKAKLTTTELGFYDNNVKIAWFSNHELHVTKAIRIGTATQFLRIGMEENGSYSIE